MVGLHPSQTADRHEESELFGAMLRQERSARVLVVSNGEGSGKTVLIRKLRHDCKQDAVPVALVDFSDERLRVDMYEAVRNIADELRRASVTLPRFEACYNTLTGVVTPFQFGQDIDDLETWVNASGATVTGRGQLAAIIVNIQQAERSEWSPEAKDQLRGLCVQLFLDDLLDHCEQHQVVLLFDALELAADAIRDWLEWDLFKHRLLRRWRQNKLVIAVAGQGIAAMVTVDDADAECIAEAALGPMSEDDTATFLKAHGIVVQATALTLLTQSFANGMTPSQIITHARYLVQNGLT